MKLLIVDDHQIFRASFIRLLKIIFHGNNRYEEAGNGFEAIKKMKASRFDVVIMDVSMPEMNGYEACKIIRHNYPDTPVIMLTQFDDGKLIKHFVNSGVFSFLTKDASIDELKTAISYAVKREKYFSEKVMSIINGPNGYDNQFMVELAPQEKVLIHLLEQGKTSKEIATEMGLTLKTVRTYRERLLEKTSTNNVAELISFGFRTGVLPNNKVVKH